MKEILSSLLFIFYIAPAWLCIVYFTLLRIEDIAEKDKHFSKNKFTYLQVIGCSLLPFLNIYMSITIIEKTLMSILSIFKKPRD